MFKTNTSDLYAQMSASGFTPDCMIVYGNTGGQMMYNESNDIVCSSPTTQMNTAESKVTDTGFTLKMDIVVQFDSEAEQTAYQTALAE